MNLKDGKIKQTIHETQTYPSFILYFLFVLLINDNLVWFYGISTIVNYLMPNHLYTYKQFYFKQFILAKVQFLFTYS